MSADDGKVESWTDAITGFGPTGDGAAIELSNATHVVDWMREGVSADDILKDLASVAASWQEQIDQQPQPFTPLPPIAFGRIEPEAVPIEMRFENVVHARVGGIAYRYPGAMSYADGILDADEEAFIGTQLPGASPAQRHPWSSMSRPRVKVRLGESVLSRQIVGALAQEYATDEMVHHERWRELHRETARGNRGLPHRIVLANRHRARRWAVEFAATCAVAGDALLEGDRGRAINILCSVVRLDDAIELTTVEGRARTHRRRFEWARRGATAGGEYLDRLAYDHGIVHHRSVGVDVLTGTEVVAYESDAQLRERVMRSLWR